MRRAAGARHPRRPRRRPPLLNSTTGIRDSVHASETERGCAIKICSYIAKSGSCLSLYLRPCLMRSIEAAVKPRSPYHCSAVRGSSGGRRPAIGVCSARSAPSLMAPATRYVRIHLFHCAIVVTLSWCAVRHCARGRTSRSWAGAAGRSLVASFYWPEAAGRAAWDPSQEGRNFREPRPGRIHHRLLRRSTTTTTRGSLLCRAGSFLSASGGKKDHHRGLADTLVWLTTTQVKNRRTSASGSSDHIVRRQHIRPGPRTLHLSDQMTAALPRKTA